MRIGGAMVRKRFWKKPDSGMDRRRAIQIRYCGGCNPEVDRAKAVKDIKVLLAGEVSFSPAIEADLLLLVNGCVHACLDQEFNDSEGPQRVSVQGNRVDCCPVCGKELAAVVAGKIRKILMSPQGRTGPGASSIVELPGSKGAIGK